MKNKKKAKIFDYFDYREYLGDYFQYLKKRRAGYSFRLFSFEAGISSHNFLPRILSKKRNLSPTFVPVLTNYLGLSSDEERYLYALVAFNNAKHPSHKEKHLRRVLSLRLSAEERLIEVPKLKFFDKWYYPIVKELALILHFKDDCSILAKNCIPRITAAQAKSALEFLVKHGFIRRKKDGAYQAVDAVIGTDKEVNSAIVPKYHKATLQQCIAALETVKKEDRNYSSVTLLLSKSMVSEIKEEIYHFRKKLLAMARECKNPDMVCFAGFQLLPRSEIIPKASKNNISKEK